MEERKIKNKEDLLALQRWLTESNPSFEVTIVALLRTSKDLEIPIKRHIGGLCVGFYTVDGILYELQIK